MPRVAPPTRVWGAPVSRGTKIGMRSLVSLVSGKLSGVGSLSAAVGA
jgi:hypothetical protein